MISDRKVMYSGPIGQIRTEGPRKQGGKQPMTFDHLVKKVRKAAEGVDISGIGFLAVQINITGENAGVFYVEVKDGRISVEPYDYHDRNCAITISMDNFNKLMSGKLDPIAGYTLGKIKVDGDVGKALEFSNLVKSRK